MELLIHHLTPLLGLVEGPEYVFQQDKAQNNFSISTKIRFQQKNAIFIVWTALSPNLNRL